jgi:GxxExxY protein
MDLLEKELTERILDAAIKVHRALGPGLLESAHEECLCFELMQRGIHLEKQKPIPLVYKDVRLECGFRADVVAESRVLLEIKAVEAIHPIHEAQLLTYLRLSGIRVGLILNFNSRQMKDGILRRVI